MLGRRVVFYLLIIGSLIGALASGRSFFFNVALLLGGTLVLALVWSWLAVRGVRLGRKTRARRAQVGRTLDEQFTVHNRTLLPKLWLEVRDESNLPGHRAGHVVPALAPFGRYRWAVQTLCTVRGAFRLGPLTVISGDPFGLFVTPRRIAATSEVIVLPRTLPLDTFTLPMGVLTGGEAQRRRAFSVTTNAAGVREYVTGDSFNRIHWPTTARRDRMMVKEFELDPLVDLWLMADFSAASLYEDPTVRRMGRDGLGPVLPSSQDTPPSTEEYLVVAAASLAQHFTAADRALGFTAYLPHREVLQSERGPRQLTRILNILAVARSVAPYTLAQQLALEGQQFPRGTTLVILTASSDPAWVVEAQVLARRGVRPTAVWVDAASFGAPPRADLRLALSAAKLPFVTVRRSDDIAAALQQRPL